MSEEETIPYTHWAYFTDEAAATACGDELAQRFDALAVVDRSAADSDKWLLRASRPVVRDRLAEAHGEVAALVEAHGGEYDGGATGWNPTAGTFL